MITDFWNAAVYGIAIKAWGIALLLVVLTYLGLLLLRNLLLRRISRIAAKTSIDFDDFFQDLLERTRGHFFLVVALYMGTFAIPLPARVENGVRTLVIAVGLIQAAFWGMALIDYLVRRRIKSEEEQDAGSETTWNALKIVFKIVLWSIIVLLILENVTGIRVNSLIASLGITGVAVALAVQNILGDLFASLSIALDKPFIIGDFIIVDDMMGTVEHIGLKSTRVRSVHGEQIVFANNDLLDSRIVNLHGMQRRRVVYPLGVSYDTPPDTLNRIPNMLREIISSQEQITFDRSHFKEFGDFALNFETVFFVESADFNLYMDILQSVNLAVYEKFAQEGIDMPYPTQKVLIEGKQVETRPA